MFSEAWRDDEMRQEYPILQHISEEQASWLDLTKEDINLEDLAGVPFSIFEPMYRDVLKLGPRGSEVNSFLKRLEYFASSPDQNHLPPPAVIHLAISMESFESFNYTHYSDFRPETIGIQVMKFVKTFFAEWSSNQSDIHGIDLQWIALCIAIQDFPTKNSAQEHARSVVLQIVQEFLDAADLIVDEE